MKKLMSTLVLAVVIQTTAAAQALRVGYYGETVTHYGLKVVREWPLRSFVKERNQAQKTILVAPGLAAYRHPHNHIGLIFFPELTYRRTGRRGGTFEAGIAPAYFGYFLDGATYTPTESGGLQRVRLAGRHAFLPTVSVGIGRDLSVRRHIPLAWYTRLNLMQQRPYNTTALFRFSLEAGVSIPLKKP